MKAIIKKIIMATICLIAFQTQAAADNDRPISIDQLPTTAQQTIKTYFADKKVAMAKVEGLIDKEYDVIFTTGEKIEFDRKGNWKDIDCKRSAVPTNIIPQQIRNYVKTNYDGNRIVKIEKDRRKGEYEIELSNDVEITFNKDFVVIDID